MNTLATVVRIGVLLVFIMPLVVSGFTIYPAIVGKSLYIRVLIEAIAALWLILIIYRPEYRPKLGPVTVALAALSLITVLATVFSVDPTRSFWSTYSRSQGVFELFHWVTLAVIAGSMFRPTSEWFDRIPVVTVVVGVIVGLLGVVFLHADVPGSLLPIYHQGQAVSTTGQHTFLAAYLVLTTCCALLLLGRRRLWPALWPVTTVTAQPIRQRLWTLFLLASVPFFGYVSWLSTSRFGFVTLAVVLALHLVVTGALSPSRRIRLAMFGSLGGLVVALVVVVALTLALDDPDQRHRNNQGANPILRLAVVPSHATITPRIHMIGAAWDSMLERPLLGYGPENFVIGWGKHIGPEGFNREAADQAHNKVAEAMATTGALGLAAWLALVGALGYVIARNLVRTRRDGTAYSAALLVALVGYVISAMFVFDTGLMMLYFCFVLIFGIALEPKFTVSVPARLSTRLPTRLSTRLPKFRIPAVDFVRIAVSVLIVSILMWSTTQVNGRYAVAATIAGQYTILRNQGNLGESFYMLALAQETFPALSNALVIAAMPKEIDRLPYLPDDSLVVADRLMTPLVTDMAADVPENWQAQMLAALWYHNLAVRGYPSYREQADHHLAELQRLSPTGWFAKRLVREWGW